MYILPRPQRVEKQKGEFLLKYNSSIVILNNDNELLFSAKRLQKSLREEIGYDFSIERREISEENIILNIDKSLREDSYILEINEKGIRITGGNHISLLYGTQTLHQLVIQSGAALSFMTIEDYPHFSDRGFYHDVTRGRIPTLDYLKSLADKLCFYKINQMQLNVEHTYMFSNLSEVWRDDTPLTAEEIMELDSYCRSLGIDLVPSLAVFGHMYHILSTKTYGDLCEMEDSLDKPFTFMDAMDHHTINSANPKSLKLSKKLIEEYMELFSSSYFNICADETFDLGKGRGRNLAEEIGTKEMYITYINELCQFIVGKGKIPMFWGDIISGFPEMINRLPKETICLTWGYAPEQREEETKMLAEAGAAQYVCPGVGGWNQWINLIESSYLNITRMCGYGSKHGAVGVLNTDWGDFGHINHPKFSNIGMIYGAAFSWNSSAISFEEINKEISKIEFRDSSESLVEKVAEAPNLSIFQWNTAVKYREKEIKGESLDMRNSFLFEFSMDEVEEANNKLTELEAKLSHIIVSMDKSMRKDIRAYMIAIHGIKLFNFIGKTIQDYYKNDIVIDKEEVLKKTQELEFWFMKYKEEWRSVSKESSLSSIQNIIHWYADSLRTIGLESK